MPPLFTCAERGDIPCAEQLFSKGQDVNELFGENTAITYASANYHTAMVKYLISKGANVKIGKINDQPFAWNAAAFGQHEILDAIIDAGAKVDVVVDGLYPIHAATINNFPLVVRRLLEVPGMDVNLRSTQGDATALILAAGNGKVEIVKILVEHPKIQLNLLGAADKATALVYAVARGHKEVVAILLKAGADPNISSSKGDAYAVAKEFGFPLELLPKK